MPIYRLHKEGQFVPLQPTPFSDLEKVLEDWIESNPQLVFGIEEPLAIIARQPRTPFGKVADLIAVDESGNLVVIELKRGQAPREVLAQVVEYAAWLDALQPEQVDQIAREYATRSGTNVSGVADLYSQAFTPLGTETISSEFGSAVALPGFNGRQRLVIIAESFSPELEQALRYLRTRFGVDITGIAFTIHREGAETVLVTETIVGREQRTGTSIRSAQAASTEDAWDPERAAAVAETDFVRTAITDVPDWIRSLDERRIRLDVNTRGEYVVHLDGRRFFHFFFARRWMTCYLYYPTDQEVTTLRSQLGEPASVNQKAGRTFFHIGSDADIGVLRTIVSIRMTTSGLA